ncbi:MAG: NERD domain-containing protein, partial [Anaerolineaceae bacterium]|nr:NERD domain-containing protein [Anaerolineaceae bacterium]
MPPSMYPETLAGLDIRSNAEKLLYEQLAQQLGNNFSVFYSVGWIGKREGRNKPSDGETDFIILNPAMGILIIEVKGGIVGFNDATGWYSIRR